MHETRAVQCKKYSDIETWLVSDVSVPTLTPAVVSTTSAAVPLFGATGNAFTLIFPLKSVVF